MKVLIIKADANYYNLCTSVNTIDDSTFKNLIPVVKVLQASIISNKDLRKKGLYSIPNWDVRESSIKIKSAHTPENLYVKTNILSEAQIMLLQQFIPVYEHDYIEQGIHTIVDIKFAEILDV